MTFNIVLKKPDKQKLCRVYLFCRINGEPCSIPTKIKILKDAWDKKKKKIKAIQPDHEKLEGRLTKRRGQLQAVFDNLELEGVEPTVKLVKERYKKKITGKKAVPAGESSDGLTVPELLFKYQNDFKASLKGSYLRKFGTFARHLNTYKETKATDENPISLRAADFNLSALHRYINDYLIDECELENNSIFDHVRKIRLVMKREASRSMVHPDHVHFKWQDFKPKPIFLTGDELAAVETVELLEEHEVYRQEFLFRCYTGLRWSDANQLQSHHFIKLKNGDIEIDFSAIKTQVNQNLLLSSKAKAIAKRWDFKVPKLATDECNKVIKTICRVAKITTITERVGHSGAKRIVTILPKYDRITTHVARRTFGRRWIELADEKGVDPLSSLMKLQKYYGHSKLQQTIDYIGWEAKEVNNEMKRLFG